MIKVDIAPRSRWKRKSDGTQVTVVDVERRSRQSVEFDVIYRYASGEPKGRWSCDQERFLRDYEICPKLTKAQWHWLTQLAVEGYNLRAPYHDNFRSFERVMAKLVELGLATPYVHGGWEITEKGRAAIRDEG